MPKKAAMPAFPLEERVQEAIQSRSDLGDLARQLCEEQAPIQSVADALNKFGRKTSVDNFMGMSRIRIEGMSLPICWIRASPFQRSSFRSTQKFSMSDDFDLEREAADLRGYVDPLGW